MQAVKRRSAEDEYVKRTMEQCQLEIPDAIHTARERRDETSLAKICDLSRSLWFAFEAHAGGSELREDVSTLMRKCVDVTAEIINAANFEGKELEIAKHYLERNRARLDWITTPDQEALRKKKAATLDLCYDPA